MKAELLTVNPTGQTEYEMPLKMGSLIVLLRGTVSCTRVTNVTQVLQDIIMH